MTVAADLEGRVYPDTPPYLVGREKIREFARAVGSTDPLSLDPDAAAAAGYADVVAPPTFAIVIQDLTLAQLLADESSMTVTSVKSLGGNAMVTSESAVRDAGGEHVVTAISTIVIRGEA